MPTIRFRDGQYYDEDIEVCFNQLYENVIQGPEGSALELIINEYIEATNVDDRISFSILMLDDLARSLFWARQFGETKLWKAGVEELRKYPYLVVENRTWACYIDGPSRAVSALDLPRSYQSSVCYMPTAAGAVCLAGICHLRELSRIVLNTPALGVRNHH